MSRIKWVGPTYTELEETLHRAIDDSYTALLYAGFTPKQASKQLKSYTAAIIRGIDARFPR